MTDVDRSNLDLGRYRYSCPAWWVGFCRGMASQRRAAVDESASRDEWALADWRRGKINEGETA
jgi:hypothetical protein